MARKSPTPDDESAKGRFAYVGLHRAIHERARLGIMASLAAHPEGLSFTQLKDLCSLTDGNLNRHLHVLEDGDLVVTIKGVQSRRPQTMCRLTSKGRDELLAYLAELEKVVADAAQTRAALEAGKRGQTNDELRFGISST